MRDSVKRLPLGIPCSLFVGIANTLVVHFGNNTIPGSHRWTGSPYSVFLISCMVGWVMGYGLSLLIQEFREMNQWKKGGF